MIDPAHAGLINDFIFKMYPDISQIKILNSLILNQKSKQPTLWASTKLIMRGIIH